MDNNTSKQKIKSYKTKKSAHPPSPSTVSSSLHWLPQTRLELDLPQGRSDRQNGNRGHPPSPSTIFVPAPHGDFHTKIGLVLASLKGERKSPAAAVLAPLSLRSANSLARPFASLKGSLVRVLAVGGLTRSPFRFAQGLLVRKCSLRYRSARGVVHARSLGSAARCRSPSGLRPPGLLHLAASANLTRSPIGSLRSPSCRSARSARLHAGRGSAPTSLPTLATCTGGSTSLLLVERRFVTTCGGSTALSPSGEVGRFAPAPSLPLPFDGPELRGS